MELAVEYKKSEVGLIPHDWTVANIGDDCYCFSGGTPTTSIREYYGGSIPWITSGDLNSQRIVDVDGRITRKGLEYSSAKMVHEGTLLLALYGATAGVAAITGIRAAINQAVLAIQTKEIDTEYLFQYLRFRKEMFLSTYLQGGQPNLSGEIVKLFKIPLPPTRSEQIAIAEALSDADAYIDSLEKLLVKKRDIKQGVMKELLTGTRRLPGFEIEAGSRNSLVGSLPNDWSICNLGGLAHIKTGTRNNEDKVENGNYPFFVRSANVERIDTFSHDCEAILIPGEGGIGSIFHYVNGRFNVHQRVYAITDFSASVSARFLFYYLKIRFGAHAMQHSVKATVDSLRLPTFMEFNVGMPSNIMEQHAIATVLSDIDAEVDLLKKKLTKARDIKQSMMQNLLTGKVRLV